MKVLKFGGSSVGNSERINGVIDILKDYIRNGDKIAVVFSAFQGVTDKLIDLGETAYRKDSGYQKELQAIYRNHVDVVYDLNSEKNAGRIIDKITPMFSQLSEILQGVYLLRELTPRSADYIVSFGEKLSNTIIAGTLNYRKFPAEYLDSTELIKTDENFGSACVDFETTDKNIRNYFKNRTKTQIITGFIASTHKNETTTLGRGGSDYTAAIYGAALNAEEIHIWTDVDGILTADPRKVKDSFTLKAVTYEEAMELSHFGAKVIHPPTMQPALQKKIKIRIKNTFNPSFKGTVILERESSVAFNIKGISSIDDISLVRVQGSGMIGVTGIASRLFGALAENKINIIMITQGSSEHSICFAILPKHGNAAIAAIQKEFKAEINTKKINEVKIENDLSVIAVVGEDMKQTPGISGKVFQALGKNGINIHAIAQGSSELNISTIIKKSNLIKALNVIHDDLFTDAKQTLNIFMAGPGLVGSELLELFKNRFDFTLRELKTKLHLVGLANSKKMIVDQNGISLDRWKSKLRSSKTKSNPKKFIDDILKSNLHNSIFVDCTAGEAYIPYYKKLLESSVSIVTPNKIANSSSYLNYIELKEAAQKHNVSFRYGTNVGAALPIINNLRDLINNGDEIIKIEGVLSGTLSYIFSSINENSKFSDIVKDAKTKGFTEPDPRDDLSGLDVARKLLILIRVSNIPFEMKNIKIENLVPNKAGKTKSINEFFKILETNDEKFGKRVASAIGKGKKLCYIAKYENGKAKVGIEEINEKHPFYSLSGNDNIIALTTKNYSTKPFVIKGPGAGADFTAFGVFIDIMRISNYLG